MPAPLGRTITAADNAWFTTLTMNANPVHFDDVHAARSPYGQRLVNSTLTLALVVGMSVTDVSRNAMANLGCGSTSDCHIRSSSVTPFAPRASCWEPDPRH